MIGLRIHLLRHGEPELRDGFYGHEDVVLSPLGQAQAAAQARALAGRPLLGIHSSDLRRARDGAALLAALVGRPPAVAHAALREMHLGVLERVSFRDARERHPELAGRRYDDMLGFRMPGGGESVQDVADRVLPCVQGILAGHLADLAVPVVPNTPPLEIAIVAHNTVNRVLLACAAGLGPAGYMRFEQGFGALSRIDLTIPADGGDPWRTARIGLANWQPPLAD
jgi:broad specificity phosphatase PhoE